MLMPARILEPLFDLHLLRYSPFLGATEVHFGSMPLCNNGSLLLAGVGDDT
jgi:hypothetical protein